MFELSVACKYLLPRRRQLSVSIISMISVLVIALVVWLIVVFFSVTDGLEKSWIQKLTALTAPVRITPTEAYYHSYYYQIDSISDASGYNHKTILEKKESLLTDPYDWNLDEEIPSFWPKPDLNASGEVKDLVKLVYSSIDEIKNISDLKAHDFELTGSQIRLQLVREGTSTTQALYPISTQSYLSYPTYLGNFESDNLNLTQTVLPIEMKDINNLLSLMDTAEDPTQEEENEQKKLFPPSILQQRLNDFFHHVYVTALKTRSTGWAIPRSLIPTNINWNVVAVFKGTTLLKVIIPQEVKDSRFIQTRLQENPDLKVVTGTIRFQDKQLLLEIPGREAYPLQPKNPLVLASDITIPAQLEMDSIAEAKRIENLKFHLALSIQGIPIQGIAPYRGLQIAKADIQYKQNSSSPTPLWIYQIRSNDQNMSIILPKDRNIGEGILLPKGFREAGALIGDRGFLTYITPTASILQEQRLPIYIAGFYDPGIIPIGGKFILANRDIISMIRASHNQEETRTATNGINVRFKDFAAADEVKSKLLAAFKEKGISRYWNVETYREYEFTKEILRELQSQKNIFSLIAVVIIVVACSNIISMLIILVNDKKLEIGILRSMGASSKSIALIFGLAGGAIGILGSVIGIAAAILTVSNLSWLISIVSRIQGYDMFNSAFYGDAVPQELSYEALSFVMIATVGISLLAGIVPAIKACLLKPTSILRSTG